MKMILYVQLQICLIVLLIVWHVYNLHYQRILEYLNADRIHVLIDGKIVESGGPELGNILEEKGYSWLNEKSINN